jgi:hypothetical protein
LGGGDGAATIMVAATCLADEKLWSFRDLEIVAVMNCLPHAAWVRLPSCGRQSHRGKVTRERDQQQEFGYQSMHASLRIKTSG